MLKILIKYSSTTIAFIFLLLVHPNFINVSNNDSLKSEINSIEGKEKVKILFELFRENLNINHEYIQKYSEEALQISIDKNLEYYLTYSYLYWFIILFYKPAENFH